MGKNGDDMSRRGNDNEPQLRAAGIGDVATIHFTTQMPDGGIVETTRNRDPFRFVLGERGIVPGLHAVVEGMQPGERRSVTLPPERAFGTSDPALRFTVPTEMLPAWAEAEMRLVAEVGGRRCDVWVVSRSPQGAILDANHPLAGRTLVYDVELVDVEPGRDDGFRDTARSGEESPCL